MTLCSRYARVGELALAGPSKASDDPPRSLSLKIAACFFGLLLSVLPFSSTHATESILYSLIHSVFDFGGGRSTSANYEFQGSIEQDLADVAVSQSANYTFFAGFEGQLVNFPPVLSPLTLELSGNGTAQVDLVSLGVDADYDSLSVPTVSAPGKGAVSASGAVLNYTVGKGFAGSDSFSFTVSDGFSTSNGTASVVDRIGPSISGSFSPLLVVAGANGKGALPNYLKQATASDNSGVVKSFVQTPAAGVLLDGGSFRVTLTATDAAGNVSHQSVDGNVVLPLVIASQPPAATTTVGNRFSLTVGATGTGPFTYQWRKAGQAISGGTTATWTVASASLGDAGSYDVVISNAFGGTVTSKAASVVVNAPLAFVTQPVGAVLKAGASVSFSAKLSGTLPMTYQWRKNGIPIVGATSATYTVSGARNENAGAYDVVVTNVVGSVTSQSAALVVNNPLVITQQPVGATLIAGGSVQLGVTATGTAPITYQWRKAGVAIAGGTGAAYGISGARDTDAGSYDVVVSNVVGSVTSAAAKLTVNTPLVITSQPRGATLTSGGPASLSVTVTGTTPVSYQWSKDGTALKGATLATLTIAKAQPVDAGSYQVTATNAAGSVTSQSAALVVNSAPVITTQPVAASVTAGTPFTLSATASGTAPLSYQWYKAGTLLAGGTGASYRVDSAQISDWAQYWVVVTNFLGSVTSNKVLISIASPPTIQRQPIAGTITVDAAGSLSATVLSSMPWTYQWKRDGVLMGQPTSMPAQSSATAAAVSYAIAKMAPVDEGKYSVVVTNAAGTVESESVGLAIRYVAPRFLGAALTASRQVLSIPNIAGTSVNGPALGTVKGNDVLRVVVRGVEPMTFEWATVAKKVTTAGGSRTVIGGQTTANLDFSQIPPKGGTYVLTATNASGSTSLLFNVSGVSGSGSTPASSLRILAQPVSHASKLGIPGWLSVYADGSPAAYRWYKKDNAGRYNAVVGGDGEVLIFNPFRSADAGVYSVIVLDASGNALQSQDATVTAIPGD